MLEPDAEAYLEVPYRTLSNPALSVWEHRRALARLRERGQHQINEEGLFRMVGEMRRIAGTAQKTTKRTGRERQHRANGPTALEMIPSPPDIPTEPDKSVIPVTRFEKIEQW